MPLPRSALVVGASGGIGHALCEALQANGAQVHRWSRSLDGLDITDEASVEAAAARLRSAQVQPDWIVLATGQLAIQGQHPERRFADLAAENMASCFAVNTIGPALLIKHLAPFLPRDRPSALVALSARLGSIGDNRLGGWMSYRVAKAALNQVLRCASIEIQRRHKQAVVVGLHPGTVDTAMTRAFHRGRTTAAPDECARQLIEVIAALTPADSGQVYDYAGESVPF